MDRRRRKEQLDPDVRESRCLARAMREKVQHGRVQNRMISKCVAFALRQLHSNLSVNRVTILALSFVLITGSNANARFSLEIPARFEKSLSQLKPEFVRETLTSDLKLILMLKGIPKSETSANFRTIFESPEFNGSAVLKFFSVRLLEVRMDTDGSCSLPGHTVPACEAFGNPSLILTPAYAASNSALRRISVLLHEARHAEATRSGYPHSICPTPMIVDSEEYPNLEGLPACDDDEWGGYGTMVVFLRNVANHCGNCSTATKNEALDLSEHYLIRISSAAARARLRADR